MERVSFTHMADGTAEDYALLARRERAHRERHYVDDVLAMLKAAGEADHGYQISRYDHSLQTATLALHDGQDEEMVVAALLHDIGDVLAPDNHSDLAAAVLKPYVSPRTHWIVLHHGIFQGYYFWHHYGEDRHARERYRGHHWFEDCANFCERYDQVAFDPNYETLPIEAFRPMVERVLFRPPFAQGQADAA